MQDRNDVFDRISEALLTDYCNFYYVNAVTHKYYAYVTDQTKHSIELEKEGDDFFASVVVDAKKCIFEDDMHYFTEKMRNDNLLLWVGKGEMESFKYRIMIDGRPVWHSLHLIRGTREGDAYFVLGVKNVDEEYRKGLHEDELKKTTIYNQIASSLASHYDIIYYINVTTGRYVEFASRMIYGALKIKEEGKDFFAEAAHNTILLVHEDDRDRVAMVLEKDYFITALEVKKVFNVDYRLVIEGVVQNMRLTGMWANDRMHLIIGVDCRDEAVRMEQEHLEALNLANERARRDELTGTKNKTAYKEFVEVLQESIEKNRCHPFAIIICDINDLKHINDTKGHKAGDDYIRVAGRMVCRTFVHSPVFRFGGDEFVIILNGDDYQNRAELLAKLRKDVIANLYNDEGPILATGMATYDPEDDECYASVFERADSRMYVDKRE
ncbi:MAG: GGDEF domain-containing protein, partial [Lachnospiraceae bacterium]|nr:GGDEF domain-containing protein [Lachnospiraceae bacterium]